MEKTTELFLERKVIEMLMYNLVRYRNGDSSQIISEYMITMLINEFDMYMKMEGVS